MTHPSYEAVLSWVRPRMAALASFADLARLVSDEQGHKHRLIAVPLGHLVDALWIQCMQPDGTLLDLILVAHDLTPAEQEHAVLHETCHMLLGHTGLVGRDVLQRLLPTIDLSVFFAAILHDEDTVRTCYCRSDYSLPVEHDAETLATLIEQEWDEIIGPGWTPPAWMGEDKYAFWERYEDMVDALKGL